MINPKLLVFILVIPIFTSLTVDYYKIDVIKPFTLDPRSFTDKKVDCLKKLHLLTRAFLDLPSVSEEEFNQLCKNATEAYDKVPKIETKFYPHFDRSTKEGLIDQSYSCLLPFYTIPLHSCQLTFDDAIHAHSCLIVARSQYYGSPDEAICRKRCCPDSLTCGADDVVEKNTLCKNPVLNRTLKENGCLKACMGRFLIRFGKQNCKSGAVDVFEVYDDETRKKFFTDDQCFMECPDEDEY